MHSTRMRLDGLWGQLVIGLTLGVTAADLQLLLDHVAVAALLGTNPPLSTKALAALSEILPAASNYAHLLGWMNDTNATSRGAKAVEVSS